METGPSRGAGCDGAPHRDRHGVEVADYAVVRLSALAHPSADAASRAFRTLWREWRECERAVADITGPVSDALYHIDGAHSVTFHRRVVLPLRRDVYNGRAPRAALRAGLGSLPARLPLLAKWLQAIDARECLADALPEVAAAALAADREALAVLCAAEPLRRAVALTSPDLLIGLDRAAGSGPWPDRRARKAEPGVLRYALRATSKTSPLSWFTYVAWGTWTDGEGDDFDDVRPVATARVSRALVALLLRRLLADPDLRRDLPHRLAPTQRTTDTQVVYQRDRLARFSTRMLMLRAERVTVPRTAALAFVLATVAGARAGVPLTVLAARLADRLATDRADGAARAASYVDRLVDEGALVPIEPVDQQHPAVLSALADWLGSRRRQDLAALLRRIQYDTHQFGRLDADARSGRLDELRTLWTRAFAGFGGETVDAPTLTEDVVVPRSAALGRRHGSHLRTQLVSLSALAELFDPATVLRRLIRDRMVERFGPAGTCSVGALIADSTDLWAAMARLSDVGADDRGADAIPAGDLTGALDHLLRLRREVTTAARRNGSGTETFLEAGLLSEVRAALPDWMLSRPASYAYFVQPWRNGSGVGWCVNHVYSGWGRFSSRFLDQLGPTATAAVAAQLGRSLSGGRVAQFRPVAGFNANLHPLLVPDEVGEDPTRASLLPEDLELAHDPVIDDVRLRIACTGEPLDVLYLGFLAPFALPDRLSLLCNDLCANRASLSRLAASEIVEVDGQRVVRQQRLRHGDVVLARHSWLLTSTTVAAWRHDLERDGNPPVAAAARWAVRLGLPDTVFVSGDRIGGTRSPADLQRHRRVPKPQFVDFGSAMHLRCLPKLLARHGGGVRIEEALPVPGTGPARRTMELVVETYRRRGER